MAKWTKVGTRRAVIVGVVAIVGVIGAGTAFIAIRGDRTSTQYALDLPSAPFGGGWACFACGAPEGVNFGGHAAGVAAKLPKDLVFRGVVVTSSAFPDGLRNVRIMRDGYYLEFTDGTVRFVADESPWAALAPELRTAVEPEWMGYLVREGVIDPA